MASPERTGWNSESVLHERLGQIGFEQGVLLSRGRKTYVSQKNSVEEFLGSAHRLTASIVAVLGEKAALIYMEGVMQGFGIEEVDLTEYMTSVCQAAGRAPDA